MKELKFTPENLKRHLEAGFYYGDRISFYTTRDRVLGRKGEIFRVDGVGYFVLSTIDEQEGFSGFANIISDSNYFAFEGFKTQDDYANELIRIYNGIPNKTVVHRFIEVYGIEEEE